MFVLHEEDEATGGDEATGEDDATGEKETQ
jgi:hypothetical protein